MHTNTDRVPFVGREQEIGELETALAGTIGGRGGIVMLVGDPGIGKTRIIEEVERTAGDRGALVVRGACYEGPSTPPYWPWIQAIRALATEIPGSVTDQLGESAHLITELVPEVGVAADAPAPDIDPPLARFRLFDAVNSYLAAAAEHRPLVIALDDLHWADRSSLDLLEFVARDVSALPILLIGAYRDVELSRRHPLSQSLAALARMPRFQRLSLKGLPQDEVGQLVDAIWTASPGRNLLDEIADRTDGNPFFVTELAREFADEAPGRASGASPPVLRVPESVREAIGVRLNRVSDECNQVLRTAAVVGREFGFNLVASVVDEISEAALLDLIEEAIGAGLVREQTAETYEFSHALIQQTLLEELSASRQARLHARILDALEAKGFVASRANEFAHHASKAVLVVGEEKVAHYSRLAGERAEAAYAWLEAQTYYEEALESLPSDASDRDRATILAGLGQAQLHTMVYPECQVGWDNIALAFELMDELGEHDEAFKMAFKSSWIVSYWLHRTAPTLSRALELVTPGSAEEAILQLRFAGAAMLELGDSKLAHRSAQRALSVARDVGDRRLESNVLGGVSALRLWDGDLKAAYRNAVEAIGIAQEENLPDEQMIGHSGAAAASLALGESSDAWSHIRGQSDLEKRYRWPITGSAWNAHLYGYLTGDRKLLEEAASVFDEEYSTDTVVQLFGSLGRWQLGEENDLERTIATARLEGREGSVTHQRQSNMTWVAVAAWATERHGDLLHAAESTRTLLAEGNLAPVIRVYARTAPGLAAVVSNDAGLAAEIYPEIARVRGKLVSWGLAFSGDRLLGLVAHTAGLHDEAIQHFDEALEFASRSGYRLEEAGICRDYAESLLRSQSPDSEKAMTLVTNGLAICQELGIVGLGRQLEALRDRVKSLSAPAPGHPDGLTSREVEVLQLIALGRTNQQIAEELVIAPTTAAKHVANILGKTSTANRAEAATYANRQGLLDG